MISISVAEQRMARMMRRPTKLALILLGLCAMALLLLLVPHVSASHLHHTLSNSQRESGAGQPGSVINGHASFRTTSKQTPEGQDDVGDSSTLSLMLLEREYHGDLEGNGKGHALGLATNLEGSVTLVTMERVTGMLQGRKGSFVVVRNVVTTHGVPEMSIVVVNDSGSGQLAGIAGKIVESKTPHTFDFYYTLPAASQKR